MFALWCDVTVFHLFRNMPNHTCKCLCPLYLLRSKKTMSQNLDILHVFGDAIKSFLLDTISEYTKFVSLWPFAIFDETRRVGFSPHTLQFLPANPKKSQLFLFFQGPMLCPAVGSSQICGLQVSSNDQFKIFERATRISSLEIPIQFAAVVGVNMLLINWQYKPASVYM